MENKKKIRDHLFTGIKRTIPFIVLYSISLALGEWNSFFIDVSTYLYMLIVVLLPANIVYSMYKFQYVHSAIISGVIIYYTEIGILGGIIVGVLIGLTLRLVKSTLLEGKVETMWHIVILNFLLAIIFPLLTYFIISPPLAFILDTIYTFLLSIDKANVMLLVFLLSLLMTSDLGGPFNKMSFAFLIEALHQGNYEIIGPVMISVTIPPLSIFLAMLLLKDKFSKDDLTQVKFSGLASLVGMTEGAIAVAFRRIKILPILIFGSVIGSMFAAYFELESNLLMASIPGLFGTSNIMIYLLSHLIGVVIILVLFMAILRKQNMDFENK